MCTLAHGDTGTLALTIAAELPLSLIMCLELSKSCRTGMHTRKRVG